MFRSRYYILDQFFAGYFPDADFDELTDQQVIEGYRKQADVKKIAQIIVSINNLMDEVDIYWKDVMSSANRYFKNSADALEWLKYVKSELSK